MIKKIPLTKHRQHGHFCQGYFRAGEVRQAKSCDTNAIEVRKSYLAVAGSFIMYWGVNSARRREHTYIAGHVYSTKQVHQAERSPP